MKMKRKKNANPRGPGRTVLWIQMPSLRSKAKAAAPVLRPRIAKPRKKRAKPESAGDKLKRAVTEYAGADGVERLLLEPRLHLALSGVYPDAEARVDYVSRLNVKLEQPPVPAAEPMVPEAPVERPVDDEETEDESDGDYGLLGLGDAGVYVLRLEGLSYQVYVGSSQDITKRVEQHRRGEGAACTKDATKIELVSRIPCENPADLDDLERKETLDQMRRLGIDKVRGWKFSTRVLSDEYWKQAFEDICCRFKLCLRCGRASHFANNCFARSKAEWCGNTSL